MLTLLHGLFIYVLCYLCRRIDLLATVICWPYGGYPTLNKVHLILSHLIICLWPWVYIYIYIYIYIYYMIYSKYKIFYRHVRMATVTTQFHVMSLKREVSTRKVSSWWRSSRCGCSRQQLNYNWQGVKMARHLRPIKWAMLPTWYHSPIRWFNAN